MKITCLYKDDIQNDPIEIVERKGLGHPDTLADGLAEIISIEYSKYTLEKYGAVLHHNLDKLGIGGGLWKRGFGYGEKIKNVRVNFGGRMSSAFGNAEIPYREIQESAARSYLRKVLPGLNVEEDLIFAHETSDHSMNPSWYRPQTLDDVPDSKKQWANDTACVVAHYPTSVAENLTQLLENYFYTDPYTPKFDFIGQDIKVMTVRHLSRFDVTMCVPMISHKVHTIEQYFEYKAELHRELLALSNSLVGTGCDINLQINTADQNSLRPAPYLTATGSCIEFGEEGYVGRGNRVNGLISIMRSSSVEAPFGKNPVYHTGRVHSYYAAEISRAIYEAFGSANTVIIKTNNGEPLLEPSSVIVYMARVGIEPVERSGVEKIIREVFLKNDHLQKLLGGYLMPKSW